MSKRWYSVCIFIFSLAVYSAAGADTLHILEKGETLYALSRKYSVPVAILLERNSINDAGKITVGQKIYIPETYTIQKGDTLYSIARKFSVTVDALRKANSLSGSDVLKVGKILIVPEKEKTAVAAGSKNTMATPQTPPASWEDPRSYTKKTIDKKLLWPVPITDISYLSGKLYGVVIASTANGNRCPRLPSSKSISIAEYDWAASFAASQIPCGSGLRPRFVCRIIPVALITFEIRFRICCVHRWRMSAMHASKAGTAAPCKASARTCLI